MSQKQTNEYEFTVDTCIGYTNKDEMFLVDIEDFEKSKISVGILIRMDML